MLLETNAQYVQYTTVLSMYIFSFLLNATEEEIRRKSWNKPEAALYLLEKVIPY